MKKKKKITKISKKERKYLTEFTKEVKKGAEVALAIMPDDMRLIWFAIQELHRDPKYRDLVACDILPHYDEKTGYLEYRAILRVLRPEKLESKESKKKTGEYIW